jgi:hypothetical protein
MEATSLTKLYLNGQSRTQLKEIENGYAAKRFGCDPPEDR